MEANSFSKVDDACSHALLTSTGAYEQGIKLLIIVKGV